MKLCNILRVAPEVNMHYSAYSHTETLMNQNELLHEIGSRVRSTRNRTGWTLREVADRSGVSLRFLSDLEAGRGNISVSRLADVARALGTALSKLLPPDTGNGSSIERVMGFVDRCSDEDLEELTAWLGKRFNERPDPLVMLVGLRGAGKSTVGSTLAKLLEVPFVELDALIEEEANLSLSELFSLHGESYYKRLAHDILLRLLTRNEQMIVATGGSIVTDPQSWSLLKRRTHTVWLKATPDDHWKRVLGQGDTRPMANRRSAMTELRSILSIRSPLYSEAAQTIDTSSTQVRAAVRLVAAALRKTPAARPKTSSTTRRVRQENTNGRATKARPA